MWGAGVGTYSPYCILLFHFEHPSPLESRTKLRFLFSNVLLLFKFQYSCHVMLLA